MGNLILKYSSDVTGGAAKAPSALESGEVAINNATGYESLFLKNSSNSIIKLPINYLKGITSDVQAQLNGKSNSNHTHNYLPTNGTAIAANRITCIDNRNVATTPDLYNTGLHTEFKSNSIAGIEDGGLFTGLLTYRRYGSGTDFSGGKSGQLAFTDNSNIWCRFGKDKTWESWKKIYHSGNSNNASTDWSCKNLNVNGGATFSNSLKVKNIISTESDNLVVRNGKRLFITGGDTIGSSVCQMYTQAFTSRASNNEFNDIAIKFSMRNKDTGSSTGGGSIQWDMDNFYIWFGNRKIKTTGSVEAGGDVIAYSGSTYTTPTTLEYTPDNTSESNSPTALDILIEKNNKLEKQVEYLMKEIENLKTNTK